MKTVGRRIQQSISLKPSGKKLLEGILFNDEMHKLPTGSSTGVKKGIYRFKDFDEADKHREDAIVENMKRIWRNRNG